MHRGRILTLDTPEGLESQAAGAIVEILAEPKRRKAARKSR